MISSALEMQNARAQRIINICEGYVTISSQQRVVSWTQVNSSVRALIRCRVGTSPAPFANQIGRTQANLSSLGLSACFLVQSLSFFSRHRTPAGQPRYNKT